VGPFVSIVLPTRNRADKLRVCLDSLVAQDHPAQSYEIVVVDDGSRDHTAAVASAFSERTTGPAVTLVRQRHRGANAARNTGLRTARGDPICFVDDDDDVPPGWLAAMASAFARYPDAHAFAGRIRLRLEGRPREMCPRHPVTSVFEPGDADFEVQSGVAANMAVRRDAVRLAGRFDEWIVIGGNETEWFERLSAAGGKTMYLAEAWLWHRRTQRELRPWHLVRTNFRRGVAAHRFFIRIGRPEVWRDAARLVPGLLRDAVRERCVGALGHAALQAGFAYGLLRHRRVEPPPRPGPEL
jgi:glycosyltransferase involved in cell wall biosynthesis